MIEHGISREDRKRLRPFHRGFQFLVGQRANEELGLKVDDVFGALVGEGGVVVNRRDIKIGPKTVKDDVEPHTIVTREETATVHAMQSVMKDFKEQGPKLFKNLPSPIGTALIAMLS